MTWVSFELAQVAATAGKIKRVSFEVVSSVGELRILPAFL